MKEREERYIVLKLSKLEPWQEDVIRDTLFDNRCDEARVDCMVCETHWPMYPQVKELILA